MKKKKLLTLVLPTLLLAPMVLSHVAQAEEVTADVANAKSETVAKPVTAVSTSEQIVNSEKAAETSTREGQSAAKSDNDGRANATTEASQNSETNAATTDTGTRANTENQTAEPVREVRAAAPAVQAASAGVSAKDLAGYTGTATDNLSDKNLSVQEAVTQLLEWAAVDKARLGKSEKDYLNFAKSLGMISATTDVTAELKASDAQAMYDIAKKLYDAYRADKKQPLFLNGRAQPIFPYTTGQKEKDEDYSYEKSDIVRFTVYVESDYDLDGDGKRDLVKTLVQLPKAVAQGDFKASTIFEARPYVAGTLNEDYVTLEKLGMKSKGAYDIENVRKNPPAKRTPVGSKSTIEAAKAAKASDWYYYSPWEYMYDYEDLTWYDYFLVRGYAFVSSAGLGTRGSEGFNTTGSDIEINAFKNIIEWINGKRVAYTDKTSNIEIKADWANGKVGMTGLSWAGTTTFGVAATGVEGLETIVPAAGIASWYDYFNSQGTSFSNPPFSDLSWLSLYVASRILDPDDWNSIQDKYADYINQLNKDQAAHGYNYSDVWKERDYTVEAASKLKTSALLVHGLNDDNVKTKHFELMYDALKKAGQNVKMYLHQGDHIYPAKMSLGYGITAKGQDFYDLLNTWLSHYLYGVDNQVEKMPAVLAQNNYDPSKWTTYDSWETKNRLTLSAASKDEEVTISSDYEKAGITAPKTNRNEAVSQASSSANATYMVDVPEDLTIKGNIPVQFRAALSKGQGSNLQVNAMLVDVSDEDFAVTTGAVEKTGEDGAFWMGSNLENLAIKQFATPNTKYKVIAKGWLNLANPDSGYASATSAKSIVPKIGEFHDYTMYLQPNVYTVKKGHKLALVLNTYDPTDLTVDRHYEVTFKTNSIKALIPIVEDSLALSASYVPYTSENENNASQDQEQTQQTNLAPVQTLAVHVGQAWVSDPAVQKAAQLPQTGSKENKGFFVAAAGALLAGFGLIFSKKKEEN
ncbi:CocE/NonD family hydrolase [Streptococcus massiliensis]|uniref:LPXTG cell wall surface protein, X-prolyl dipeptidylaminopeptidase n=1 Tax=Streptococcus massiliensis TaxID=313439 RepID=A0A380KV37_9STRE|nr:CocE/NonD family hydrolase [Streptococcus massiliensis]SUN75762.1 LPXTG cell wall surface protein, X-prolyl dipeptidylaminopeptidase [Streptococcus massiliensis]